MTPARGLVVHNPPHATGDCLRACVASIFDLPPEEVPHFVDGEYRPIGEPGWSPWWIQLQAWLHERGFGLFFALIQEPEKHWGELNMDFHYVLGGYAKSGLPHSVVARGREIVHDPAAGTGSAFNNDAYPQHYLIFVKR